MAAYVIVDTKIHDTAGYEEYKPAAVPRVEGIDGLFLQYVVLNQLARGAVADIRAKLAGR